MLPTLSPRRRPERRRADPVPAWAAGWDDRLDRIDSRLSRIEGGLVLAAFLVGLIVTLAAPHILTGG